MRGIVILTVLAASLAYSAANDYVEVRDLRLPAEGLAEMQIDAGAGSLTVSGVTGASAIVVTATVTVPTRDLDKARSLVEKEMRLKLEKKGDRAVLVSHFEHGPWSSGDNPRIDLEVIVPQRFTLRVDDGSGPLEIDNVLGDITIDDSSGSMSLSGIGGTVDINDGSGSISVRDVGASLSIVDGSGSITVRTVGGSVFVEDGSGSIDVSDVAQDLIIEDDGSGGLTFTRVQGRVEKPD